MEKLVNKSVDLDLVGIDGNAYSIMGAFQKRAWIEGWSSQEIEKVLDQAKLDDYDHLLAVIQMYCEPKRDWEEDEWIP